MNFKKTAPTDVQCAKAWGEIMGIAKTHALLTMSYGGVATLMTPYEQRQCGARENALTAADMDETEDKVGREVAG